MKKWKLILRKQKMNLTKRTKTITKFIKVGQTPTRASLWDQFLRPSQFTTQFEMWNKSTNYV